MTLDSVRTASLAFARQLLIVARQSACAYSAHVGQIYDVNAPKRPVNMTLNEDLVRCVREYTTNLSEQVEKLLADFVLAERKRRAEEDSSLDAAIAAWNNFYDKHGSLSDEHSDL